MIRTFRRNKVQLAIAIPAVAIILGISGCSGLANSLLPKVQNGTWGGNGAGLQVTDTGASVGLNCGGTGTISLPMLLNASGNFSITGTEVQVSPGPAPVGGFPTIPVTYSGTVNGQNMTLTITPISASGATTYHLTYQQNATLITSCP